MISHNEAQEMHRIIGQSMVSGDTAELERALELASIIVSDTDEGEDWNESHYHWTGWEAEADFEPGRPDTYFLTICYPDGEEMAVIVHRTVDGAFPLDGDLAKSKEARAQQIVDALNRQ